MRIYIVTPTKSLPHQTKPRLIRAATPAQAVRFATSECGLQGIKAEDANG